MHNNAYADLIDSDASTLAESVYMRRRMVPPIPPAASREEHAAMPPPLPPAAAPAAAPAATVATVGAAGRVHTVLTCRRTLSRSAKWQQAWA